MTSAGGVASTDLMLHMIEQGFGRELRIAVADMCLQLHVRSPQDMQRSLASTAFGIRNPKLSRAIEFLEENLRSDLKFDELADSLEISRRQLERMFARYTGMSPKKFATKLRLDRAYSLLIGTNMTIAEITDAAGSAHGNFNPLFKRRFGVLPRNLTRQTR
jgi:transcriptional regulator GlxA family with amidase domain